MATITKRKIRLEINWEKDDPTNFSYRTVTWAYLTDDTKAGGEEELIIPSDPAVITRTAFRALTGQQIETNAAAIADAALQALGSGAGSHTIVDDSGD